MNYLIGIRRTSVSLVLCILSLTLLLNATPAAADGTLTVRLLPVDIQGSGSWFSIDGGDTRHPSGTTISIPAGNYTITIGSPSDYDFPPDYNFSIADGQNLSFVFRFTGFTGWGKINITPAGAIAAGARWSPDYGATTYASGESVPLAMGTWPISFTDASGYTTPSGFNIVVDENTTTELSVSYEGNTGALAVAIESQTTGEDKKATDEGARWRVTSDGVWRRSGNPIPSLPEGSYTIEFNDVTGWKTPNDINVNIVAGQTANRTGTYIRNEVEIRGRIVDEFGSGLDNATITLSSNKGTQTVTTSPSGNGAYQFTGLTTNTKYSLSVYRQDYEFAKSSLTQQVAGTGGVFYQDTLEGVYTPSNLSISGQVQVGESGPLLRSGITLMLNNNTTTTTNELGKYTFENLSGGTYSIKMLPKAGYDVPGAPRTVKVPRTKSKQDVNWFITNNSLKISGQITQTFGNTPVSGVTVRASKGGVTKSAVTSSNGKYTITGLGTGKWTVKPIRTNPGFDPENRVIYMYDSDFTYVDFISDPPVLKQLRVGNFTVYADSIVQQSANEYLASGNVTLGAHKMVRVNSNVTINTRDATISGQGRVNIPAIPNFGNMTLYNSNFEIDASGDSIPGTDINFDYLLFKIAVEDFAITNSSVNLDVTMGINFVVQEIEIAAGMRIDNSGLSLNSFDTFIATIPFGLWELADTTAFYDADENAFGGGTTLSTPLLDVEARMSFLRGALDSIFFAVNRSIPIHPPVFYLSRIGGGVSNLNNDKPIQIEAEAEFEVGKKLGKLRMVTIDGRVVVVLSGSFEVSGSVYVLDLEAGGGRIAYTHSPNRHFLAEAHMLMGLFPQVQINGEINLTFEPFNVWGSASAVIKLAVQVDFVLFKADVEYTLGGAGASFTKDELRVWSEILGARLEGLINGDGFRITKPSWLTGVRISFDEDDPNDPDIQVDGLGRNVNMANNLKAVTVSGGLGEAHFFLAWEQGDSQPSITSPSGVVFDGSDNGFTYNSGLLSKQRFAWFKVSEPEAGVWGINYTNSGNIGETYAELTEYPFPPGIAISNVEELGTNLYRINLLRSNLEGEQVEIFFEPADRKGSRIALAGPDQIGDAMSYDWDTTTVAPGTYSLYARVYDSENHPFLFQYDKLMRIEGDSSRRISGRPKAKTKNDVVKVSWKRLNDEMIMFYRIYYTDDLKSDGFKSFVDIEAGKNRAELDSETLKPGRRYRIAITPVYEDGSEGPLSKYQTFTYKTKKENNHPQIGSTPKDIVSLGKTYSYQVKSKDFDRDKVYYRLIEAPEGMEINSASGLLKWDTTDADPGVKAVAIQATDSNGDTDVQRYNLLVSDSSQQGILMVRPVHDSNGNQSYVVSYWNPFLNFQSKKAERLPALLRTAASPAGINIRLREAGKNWGYFSAVVGGEEIRKVREAAAAEVGPAAVGLNNLVIEMVGKHRKEKISADLNKR